MTRKQKQKVKVVEHNRWIFIWDKDVMGDSSYDTWAVFGDSNQVFCPCENLDAYESNIDIQTPSLVIIVIQSALGDLNIMGSSHSWWIKRRGNPTTKKLD